jgi:hypothetical protein
MSLRPGQCDIKEISLSNNAKSQQRDKTNGLLDFIQSVDIYESIYTPYIVVDVSITDGASLKETLNLSGGEDFKIKFLGYGNDEPIELSLKLGEISGIITAENLRSKAYKLRMYSNEYLLNSAKTISKSYSTSTENIVKDIVGSVLGSKKTVTVESTKDLPVVVIPYMSPFTALSFIRQRSVSTNNQASPLLFFENKYGYFFTSVYSIVQAGGAGSKIVDTFFQREAIATNVKGSEGTISDINAHKLFANYTVKTPVDVVNLLDEGGLNSVVSDYDLNTKTYRRRVYTNTPSNKTFVDFTDGGNSLLTGKISEDYAQYTGKGFLLPFAKYKDTTNPTNNFLYDSLAEKYSYTNLLAQQKTYIDIPGNTKITAGSIIELVVPRHDSLFDKKDKNEVESGKYLVSSVRHTLSVLVDSKYDTHLELIRYGRGTLST